MLTKENREKRNQLMDEVMHNLNDLHCLYVNNVNSEETRARLLHIIIDLGYIFDEIQADDPPHAKALNSYDCCFMSSEKIF